MNGARSACSRRGIAAEQANAPDRGHESSQDTPWGRAAGDWRRWAPLNLGNRSHALTPQP
jgi:hypothetical protein